MFVGREKELSILYDLLQKKNGSVLIYGKRKVGKTTLIAKALEKSTDKTVYYECIKSTMRDNIDAFTDMLVEENILPVKLRFGSFVDVFKYLNSLGNTFNIVIDEYPYLKQYCKKDEVDSVFQKIIDNHIGNIRLFLSGSHIGMMKDLLEEKNALFGRFTAVICLQELNYLESSLFYSKKSEYEKIAFYAVFGGSPFVNGFINQENTLQENIINVLLNSYSVVFSYIDNLLISDYANAVNAERIFNIIANGKKRYSEIESGLEQKSNGLLSSQLNVLLSMDILSKVYPINKTNDKKKAYYILNDNLLRFYFTYIYRNKSQLQVLGAKVFYEKYIEPSLLTFISHRFEEICRSYFSILVKTGKLSDVYDIGTYYYDSEDGNGEFDVALKRKDGYDIFEVKYYQKELSVQEMAKEEMQVKTIKELKINDLGFISTGGYEPCEKYTFVPIQNLYQIE